MTLAVLVMYAVAVVTGLAGLGMLLRLRRPAGPAQVYVFRMVGIMLGAFGVVMACSATAMWSWGAAG